ncbi:unnamed protein product [Moneuplotes crassus]|uniref:Kelch motif family protein n=1 Tax=Euplotes crassus TaxID=5936 RepID=A0AAD1U8D1_EUPCR|nr:unnamed protein product [Moneuplotes crassus]
MDEYSGVQSNYQSKMQSSRTLNDVCELHQMNYVGFCAVHQELVCEDCTDSEKHIHHSNKILLLKAAARDIVSKISNMTNELFESNDFKIRTNFRAMIMDFFEFLHEKLREIEREKMKELREMFAKMNCDDLSKKAEYLQRKQCQFQKYVKDLREKYNQKKYTRIIENTDEIKEQMDSITFHQQEIEQCKKDLEKFKNLNIIRKDQKSVEVLSKVVSQCIKVPNVRLISEEKDILHFFVYNSHSMYKYNIKSSNYEVCRIPVKIPANFMSIETDDGRIFISGGGEPGKARKTCYEFLDNTLIPRKDMIYERRAHTLTEIKDSKNKSHIYAIGSSLPTESMNKCEYYDVVTNTWTSGPSLNTKRNFHSSIAFKKYIYVMAGFNGGQRTNIIERLDTFYGDEWNFIDVKMKNYTKKWVCLEGCGLYTIDSTKILIFGGYTSSERKSRDCFMFYPESSIIERINCKTASESNFYQRQPKMSSDGNLYSVETNSLDIHIFDINTQTWSVLARKDIGW